MLAVAELRRERMVIVERVGNCILMFEVIRDFFLWEVGYEIGVIPDGADLL
jgi:hypothetical protein